MLVSRLINRIFLFPPVCLVWIFFTSIPVYADVYIDMNIYGYSETVPIVNAVDQWDGPFTSGTDVFSHDLVEIGISEGRWRLGLLKRYDYELKFSEATSEFYYRINNSLALDVNRTYDLDIVIRQTYSEGVRLAYADSVNDKLDYQLSLSYLRGIALTDGFIRGSATATTSKDYDFLFDVSYVYSRDTLFDRIVDEPSGEGMALDLAFDWRLNNVFTTHLSVKDLYTFIRWYDAPYTTAVASSASKTYDENNYVVYNPVISGLEKNRDFTQRIPMRVEIEAEYSIAEQYSLVTALNLMRNFNYYQVGLNYALDAKALINAMYIPGLRSVSLAYRGEHLNLQLITDSLKINSARSLGFHLAYVWVW